MNLLIIAIALVVKATLIIGMCQPGKTWIEGQFKMECYQNGQTIGYRPVACVPNGQGNKEYNPGESWINNGFKVQCQAKGYSISTGFIACIEPTTKKEVAINGFLDLPGQGRYLCNGGQDGSVSSRLDPGCVHGGQVRPYNSVWTDKGVTYKCTYGNSQYQVVTQGGTGGQGSGGQGSGGQGGTGGTSGTGTGTGTGTGGSGTGSQTGGNQGTGGSGYKPLCEPDKTWIEGQFKMICIFTGTWYLTQPIACVPGGKLGGPEYNPGETWIDGSFKYICVQPPKKPNESVPGLTYEIAACLTQTKQEIKVGSSLQVPGYGLYECIKYPNNTIYLTSRYGCVYQGKIHDQMTTLTIDNTQLTCVYVNGVVNFRATGCITSDKQVVGLGAYQMINGVYYRCAVDEKDPLKAEFKKVPPGSG